MSIDASRWAWTQQVDPSLKIVLLSLADRADDIKKALKNLEKLGLIAIVEDNTYFLKRGV